MVSPISAESTKMDIVIFCLQGQAFATVLAVDLFDDPILPNPSVPAPWSAKKRHPKGSAPSSCHEQVCTRVDCDAAWARWPRV